MYRCVIVVVQKQPSIIFFFFCLAIDLSWRWKNYEIDNLTVRPVVRIEIHNIMTCSHTLLCTCLEAWDVIFPSWTNGGPTRVRLISRPVSATWRSFRLAFLSLLLFSLSLFLHFFSFAFYKNVGKISDCGAEDKACTINSRIVAANRRPSAGNTLKRYVLDLQIFGYVVDVVNQTIYSSVIDHISVWWSSMCVWKYERWTNDTLSQGCYRQKRDGDDISFRPRRIGSHKNVSASPRSHSSGIVFCSTPRCIAEINGN